MKYVSCGEANCDEGVLARRVAGRDPVVGLVTMSDGVDRQTLAAHERGAVDAGQFPSFTGAAERQGLLTGTTG